MIEKVAATHALRLSLQWAYCGLPMALIARRCRVRVSEFGRPPRFGAPSSGASAVSRRCPDAAVTTYAASLPFEHHRPTLSG